MEQWNSGGGVVYLKLDMDGADGKALHPYSWIPPTGNVMYCMPQEGTEAYLYFPEAEEGSAGSGRRGMRTGKWQEFLCVEQ